MKAQGIGKKRTAFLSSITLSDFGHWQIFIWENSSFFKKKQPQPTISACVIECINKYFILSVVFIQLLFWCMSTTKDQRQRGGTNSGNHK